MIFEPGSFFIGFCLGCFAVVIFFGLTTTESQAIRDVESERRRQVTVEGWTSAHDDGHTSGQLAAAAALYAMYARTEDSHQTARRFAERGTAPALWPWSAAWFKPRTRRRDLIRAAALLIAEIERLDRMGGAP